MTSLRILLFAGLLSFAHGQTYRFDTGAGISQSVAGAAATSLVTATATGANTRKMCYDGTTVLRTSGSQVVLGANTVEMMTPNGEAVEGLACCCNLVAITYSTATEQRIRFKKRGQSAIYVDEAFVATQANPNANSAVLECNPTTREIFVLSLTEVWRFNIDDLAATPDKTTITGFPIVARPTCVSTRKNGDIYDIYVSSVGNTYVDVLQLNTAPNPNTLTTSRYSAFVAFSPVEVTCVDYDQGGDVYLLTENADDTQHHILRVTPTAILMATAVTNPTTAYTNTGGGITSANGIDVCGTICTAVNCADNAACACTGACGFCLFQATVCQCGNSLDVDPCFYSAAAAPACEQCLAQLDAQVLVLNPLAKRREGDVKVYGVLEGAGAVPIVRAVRVGRFGPAAWPLPHMAAAVAPNVASPRVQGFDAPAPNRLRGSRFGVYLAEFDSANAALRDVNIPAIVTENSGFTNAMYTSTVNRDGTAMLVAAMTAKLLPFVGTLRWMFTPYDFETKMTGTRVAPSCTFGANRLSCTLTNCQKANEGVYEVFRPRRERRNWHPIFFLYVRKCPVNNQYGATCTAATGTCVNGAYDDTCGYCVCAPGWQGAACDVRCGTGDMIGSTCTTACSTVLPGTSNCVGVLICRSGKLGCACRHGLKAPDCQMCDTGFWGTGCFTACGAACPTTCDSTTGACPP